MTITEHTDLLIVLQNGANRVLGVHPQQIWYSDWKIWIGITMYTSVWFKWLYFGYERKYHIKALHVLAFNLVVLHLLQFWKSGFRCVLLLIIIQNLMAAKIFYRDRDLMKIGVFKADNIYSAISAPVLQACFVFVGQLLFIGFYFYALCNGLEDLDKTGHYDYFFWWASYIAVQMTLYFNRGKDSQLGQVMDMPSSVYLWKNIRNLRFSYITFNGEPSEPFPVSVVEWAARCIMNFLVNMIIRDLVAFTVPVLLMSFHDPLNCVVYSVGVNFIATMDDCSEIAYTLTWQEGIYRAGDLELDSSPSSTPRVTAELLDESLRTI